MVTEPDRLDLARLPTPLERVNLTWQGHTSSILIKRDDLTGMVLSGNKIRKLEYLLADARRQGATRVLTCGGIQSNHCRATAIAATRLGMKSLVLLRSNHPDPNTLTPTGNWKLCNEVGAQIRFVTPEEYAERSTLMETLAGPSDYVIPEGGSNGLGAWGYVRTVDELIAQWSEPPSSIVCAVGSGGTMAGLMMGLRRRELSVPVYGVCVCDDAPTFQKAVATISQQAHERWPSLPSLEADEVHIVEGFVGRGYALSTPEELADISKIAQMTGMFLDPVYTGKAFRALLMEPQRFGPTPLFIHTGGLFGLLA
jgi:D-cysteine desulfhydrase